MKRIKRITRIGFLSLFLGVALLSFMTESRAWSVNTSLDPFDVYGNCGGSETGLYGNKANYVLQALKNAGQPETMKDVLAIKLLSCKTFSGMGPSVIAPCPSGSPYTYCVGNDNDGAGHNILLGVLKRNAVTNPNATYSGCTGGGTPHSKLALYQRAGGDPLMINGIVTLQCGVATGVSVNPKQVACPSNSPFKYCVKTSNDGHGNAVLLGAIGANGAGDPYALYGNCTSFNQGQPGYRAKADVLTDLGISLNTVRTIDILGCVNPDTTGDNPPPLRLISCSNAFWGSIGNYYDQCVGGLDAKNNNLYLGINK
ncbi:MAG: hypothetical protein PHO08_13785 [Methylococcales bacterium]|nr:hypothetical protein [Methylococcales bacterium]